MTQVGPDASLTALAGAAGLVVLAGGLAAAMAVVHRWYARSEVPPGLSVLVGLGGVALSLNTAGALGAVIGGDRGLLTTGAVAFNAATLLGSAVVAAAASRAADRAAVAVAGRDGDRRPDVDVSRLVRSMGRAITVELPAEVADIEGYDPVEPARKERLAGETLVFSRGLTVAELRERLVARLKDEYGVGHVDVDLDEEGTVTHLGVGSRAAGLGPTLPPGSAAVAIRSDPAHAASAGDLVQLWRASDDGAPERVATGDLRGTAGDVVTVAVDVTDVDRLSPTEQYRVVTLPVEPRADREFAALLRAADETLGVTTVAAGSHLVGSTVGDIDATVVAVASEGQVDPIPPRARTLEAGETIYAIGRPDRLRTLEVAARPPTDSH